MSLLWFVSAVHILISYMVSNIVLVTALIICVIHLYVHLIITYYCIYTVTAYCSDKSRKLYNIYFDLSVVTIMTPVYSLEINYYYY